jgi:hypothetical protein
MGRNMSNHFEELEEQLKRLETIPVVSTGTQGRAAGREALHAAGAPSPVPTTTENSNGESGQHSRIPEGRHQFERGCDQAGATVGPLAWVASVLSHFGGRGSRARLRALEEEAVSEWQERMREAVSCVVEDARRQLEALTSELVPTLQSRPEKIRDNSVGTISAQLVKQFEQQVHPDIRRGAAVTPIMKPDDPAKTMVELRKAEVTTDVEQFVDTKRIQTQLTQAFTPVVEEIQLKSAAFLDHLNLQLHSTLRAFGEKATKHAAEEFGRIAVELLKGEVRCPRASQRAPGKPAVTVAFAPVTSPTEASKLNVETEAISASHPAPHETTSMAQTCNGPALLNSRRDEVNSRGAEKVPASAANWRILGLS